MKTPVFWRSMNTVSCVLLPLSALYFVGSAFAKALAKPARAPIPVIAIGNATVGGAGKTPMALALAPLLTELGKTPHFLTRGYKSETPLTAHRVTGDDDWHRVGDEALLLAKLAPTWVGRERLASAQAAAQAGADVAVCDDALQHHQLHKDLTFLVIDGPYGIGNGKLLPAGPLREPFAHAVARSDAVILIGEDRHDIAPRLNMPVFHATIASQADPRALQQSRWLAFAGIGRPEKFFTTLRTQGAGLAGTRSFPDHHAYSEADMASLAAEAQTRGAQLITTEKDAVKLPATWCEKVTVVPISLQFENLPALRDFLALRLR